MVKKLSGIVLLINGRWYSFTHKGNGLYWGDEHPYVLNYSGFSWALSTDGCVVASAETLLGLEEAVEPIVAQGRVYERTSLYSYDATADDRFIWFSSVSGLWELTCSYTGTCLSSGLTPEEALGV